MKKNGAKDHLFAVGLFLLLVSVFLQKGLLPSSRYAVLSSIYNDIAHYFFPMLSFGFGLLKQGIIPFWNPYIFCGAPFLANIQTSIFYPLNFLYLLLEVPQAINYTLALHLFLSAIFTYLLLLRYKVGRFGSIVGAIVYTFQAPQIMHIYAGHPHAIAAMAWLPMMIFLLDKLINEDGYKWAIFLSIAIAFQFLAGYTQYFFYSMTLLCFYLLFFILKKRDAVIKKASKIGLFAMASLLGLSLCAIQLLPSLEMVKYSGRSSLSFEWIANFSFPPANLITFLIPDFFGNVIDTPYWGRYLLWDVTAYIGILPLLLALIAIWRVKKIQVRFFIVVFVASIILAMGKFTPMLKILYSHIPGFNLFRGSAKWIFISGLSLSILSGFGADFIAKNSDRVRTKKFLIPLLALIGALIAILTAILFSLDVSWFKEAIKACVDSEEFRNIYKNYYLNKNFIAPAIQIFRGSLIRTLILLISSLSIFLLFFFKKIEQKILIFSLASIIIIDLFSFGMQYMNTFDSRLLKWDKKIADLLSQEEWPTRTIASQRPLNSAILSKVSTPNGYDAIDLKRYSEFISLLQGLPLEADNMLVMIDKINKFTDMLNTRYFLLPANIDYRNIDGRELDLIYRDNRYGIYQNPKAIARAFIAHKAHLLKEKDEIFKLMLSDQFDPLNEPIIEGELDSRYNLSGEEVNSNEKILFKEYLTNSLLLDVYLDKPGLLVLNDTYYPAWQAEVDGRNTKVYPVNYIMRGVLLPAGAHSVRFYYDTGNFMFGALISLLAIIVLLAAFLTSYIYNYRRGNLYKKDV